MRLKELDALANRLATEIMYGLQIDRTGVGEYMVSGYPDDYRIYVSQHVQAPLDDQELPRVASSVKSEVDDYLDGILRVGDQVVRHAQDPNQIVELIGRFGPEANSYEELWGNIEGALDLTTLPEQFMPLIQAAYEAKQSGDWTTFHQIVMEVAPDVATRIPAMPGVEYGTESVTSVPMTMTTMPGMPMPAKGLAPAAQKLFLAPSPMPIRIVKHAQGEGEWSHLFQSMEGREPTEKEEEKFDYLDYYTQGVEPGSKEETELLINLDPLETQVFPEEAPTTVPEFVETAPLTETEEEREVSKREEEPEEEKPEEEAAPSPQWQLPRYETETTPYAPDVPAWWRGFWGIMAALPEYRYDELRERLESNVDYREAEGESLYVRDLRDNLVDIGEQFDVTGLEDPDQRALARSRARQKAFDEVWSPYALLHAFTLGGMTGVRAHQRMLEGWMTAHFPPEFAEKFREVVRLSSGSDMEERFPDLLRTVYWWRDPEEGMGHGTDPTQWDSEFLRQVPETLQFDTELKLGDDPRAAIGVGTVTVDHPVYRTYVHRSEGPEKPITYERGVLRPDDPRNVALEFPEAPERFEGPGFASERQRRWWHAQR